MNRFKNIIALFIIGIAFTACNDDFLERYPLDALSPQTFFQSEAELETYVNSFYSYLPGDVWNGDFTSDNIEKKAVDIIIAGQHNVETDAASAGWTWGFLRNVNFFLENVNNNEEVPLEVRNHYAGIARFFRAWFYFDKVKRFGNVPWYDRPLSTDDEDLFKGQDPRDFVMDNVLNDLNFAVENVRTDVPTNTISRWTALALKARVGLHEGTFRKYHSLGNEQKFLDAAVDAAKTLIESEAYTLYTTGNPNDDYRDLFAAEDAITAEVILARVYGAAFNQFHTGNGQFLSSTLSTPGFTKNLIDSYLLADGTPFTAQPGADTMTYFSEMQNRDPRLAQSIRSLGYTRIGDTEVLLPDFNNARTGYQGIKFVMSGAFDGFNANTNDLPIFRFAETLLIYAEALAELGQLTQSDLDISINRLRDRVGMPPMQLGSLTVDPFLAGQYPNVSGAQQAAILEIRRERRVELAMEGFRYDDVMRWKAGQLFAETFRGMYFPSKGFHDLDRDGTVDLALLDEIPAEKLPNVQYWQLGVDFVLSEGDRGNLIVHPTLNKVFDESKHYFFPLPRTELLLNNNLTQNPGWN